MCAIIVNQIIEMHSRANKYFEDGSVMLILRPLEVQGKDISKIFFEWEPESSKYVLLLLVCRVATVQ